jgi:hypothetical protein
MEFAEQPRLVELGAMPEFWCDGVGRIEALGGGTYRLLLYRVHHPVNGEGPTEHEIVAAVLTNLATLSQALPMLQVLVAGAREGVALLM